MTSVSSVNNTAALAIMKSIVESNGANGQQAKASTPSGQISSMVSNTAQQAIGEIARILLENGGQVIIGGAFSDIQGGDGDDYIFAEAGSSVNGGAGNDYIEAGPSSTVHGGAGNDYMNTSSYSLAHGDEGDDYIVLTGTRTTAFGDEGNDVLESMMDGVTLHGNAGNDRLSASGNGNLLEGGKGDDVVSVIGGIMQTRSENRGVTDASIIKFAVGDGKDTVRLLDAKATLQLGDGLSSEKTKVTISGDLAVLTFDGNDGDQITIAMTSKSSLTIAFADGSEMKLDGAQVSSKQAWQI